MSTSDMRGKVEALKEALKALHRGEDPERVKEMFRGALSRVSPFEIPLIEQELVKEGVPVQEIMRLCDLHVELFREFLESRELKDVPKGHPLDLLLRENRYILRKAEELGLVAGALAKTRSPEEAAKHLEILRGIVEELRGIRLHYRKVQMLLFPYLERRGIAAVPRVLWSREDQVVRKLRALGTLLSSVKQGEVLEKARVVSMKAMEVARELSDLVFRENKILYPALWAMLSEGEWAAIKEMGEELGYIIDTSDEWKPRAKPIYPYELENPVVTDEQLRRIPDELRTLAVEGAEPDTYRVRKSGDIELETGFLSRKELEALFRALPIEITFADSSNRVKFYSRSRFVKGFTRVKTLIGRRVEYCHPPRLEKLVMKTVEELRRGEKDYAEFWTRVGNRVIRVFIAAVRSKDGEYLGAVEVVEDLTDVVKNPEEVLKRIMVL